MRKAAKSVRKAFDRFTQDKDGATAIEYGLIAAGISVVIIATVFLLGGELDNAFNNVLTCIQTPASCSGP